MMLTEILDKTLDKWRSEDVSFRPGATHEKITYFEKLHGVIMPADLRTYFMVADGMGAADHWAEDHDMLSFLRLPDPKDAELPNDSINYVAPLSVVWPSKPRLPNDLFVIVDWSFHAFVICARMSVNPAVISEIYFFDGDTPLLLTSSFTEFLELYVEGGLDSLWP